MNLAKNIFKTSRPVIRKFDEPVDNSAGDLPYLWDVYKKGGFEDLPPDLEIQDFFHVAEILFDQSFEMHVVEDYVQGELIPVAVIMIRSADAENWQIEPHVVYFDNATARIKLRVYFAFLKKTKYRKDIGSCVLRVHKEGTKLANKALQNGLLNFVGKVRGGRPEGSDYIYSLRCNRRH